MEVPEEISIIAKFKTSSVKTKLLKNFRSSLYSGPLFIAAVDGVGLFLYSVADLKCIKSLPIEASVSFQCVPNFDPATESFFVAILSKDQSEQTRSVLEARSLHDSSPLARFDLDQTAVRSMEKVSNEHLLVCSVDEAVFLFSNRLQLLDRICLESCIPYSSISNSNSNSSFLVKNCLSDKILKTVLLVNATSQLTALYEPTPIHSEDLIYFSDSGIIVALRKSLSDLLIFNCNENISFSHKIDFPIDSIVCCKAMSDKYCGILTREGKLLIFDFGLNVRQLELELHRLISESFDPSDIKDFFLIRENDLCLVFEDSFGLVKLPVSLKEFNLAQAFASKSNLQLDEIPANLALKPEQLLYNLDKLPKLIVEQNLESLLKTESISSWLYPNLLSFLIAQSNPALIVLFIENSLALKEQDFIQILEHDSSHRMLILLFEKDAFTTTLMTRHLSKCSEDFIFPIFKSTVQLIKTNCRKKQFMENTRLVTNLIEFIQCIIDAHFMNFLLAGDESFLAEFKEAFQFIREFEMESKEVATFSSYLDTLKRDVLRFERHQKINSKYSVETINF